MPLSRGGTSDDSQIRALEERIRQEEARQDRMILQGMPTQAGDDVIRQLRTTLQRMKQPQPRPLRR